MPLPTLHTIVTNPNPATLTAALNNHPAVTAGNEVFQAKTGNLNFAGNTMTVSGVGVNNYWYIPAVVGKVSYCTVPCGGGGDAYVISDQYGGCEYHELYNATFNMLAFLHVYRGDGMTTQYAAAPGWVLQSVKRSFMIAQAHGMAGSNWSVTHINLATAATQSKFVHVGGYPNLTVTGEQNGDAAYPVAAAVVAAPNIFQRLKNLLRRN